MTRRELALLAAALAVVVAALPLAGGAVLWTRPFWMDEIAMFFLTSEPPGQMLRLVARGGDWNPPTLHLLVSGVMRVAGLDALTPVFLRSIALACVVGAIVLVYVTLRRRTSPGPAVAGVLALAAQSLVLEHAFEGRFYAPWLLFAAAFAWSLGIHQSRPGSRLRDAAIALAAVLVATIHWYGVFSLALMCVAAVIARRADIRAALRLVAPAAAGVVAVAACAPIAISQRASAAPVLWVHPLSLAQVDQFARQFIPGTLVVIVALVMVVEAVRRGPAGERPPSAAALLRDPGIAALLACAFMPFVLMVLSVVVTPSMVFRYAIVATLAWAVAVAMMAHQAGRVARGALLAALAVFLVARGAARVAEQRQFARVVALNRAGFERAKQDGVPVVFQRLHVIYPVAATERAPGTPARYLDISDSVLSAMYPQAQAAPFVASLRLDRDQARYHAGIYGWPVMAPVAGLDTVRKFYLVSTDATLPPGYAPVSRYAAALFPRHRVRRLSPVLSVLERDSLARP